MTHATSSRRRRQSGAAALEFALLFLFFFAVLYGVVGYSLMFLIQQGLTQAASAGARAAVRLDPGAFSSQQNYRTAAQTLARQAALDAMSWLPAKAYQKVTQVGGIATSWTTGTQVVTTGGTPLTVNTQTLTVTIRYNNYRADPLLPAITMGALGSIPPMPLNLVGTSTIQP